MIRIDALTMLRRVTPLYSLAYIYCKQNFTTSLQPHHVTIAPQITYRADHFANSGRSLLGAVTSLAAV